MKFVLMFSLMFFVTSLSAPVASAAVENGGGTSRGLVTCGNVGQPDCDLCTLVQMVDRVLDFLFVLLTLAAVLMVMYAGFQLVMSQGNSGAMEKAKGMVGNIIIGFIIVLAAWLIIDTVMKGLVKENSGFGQWNEIGEC
jgi:hypothetical protein